MYTKKGQRFTNRVLQHKGLSSSNIREYYGPGIAAYFDFVSIIGSINIILSIIGIISWSLSLVQNKTNTFRFFIFFYFFFFKKKSVDVFFVSSYHNGQTWFVTSMVMIAFWFLLGPIYLVWEYYKNEFTIYPQFLFKNSDKIHENTSFTTHYITSWLLLVVTLVIATGIFFGLLKLQSGILVLPLLFIFLFFFQSSHQT